MADYNINAITRRVVFTGSAGLGPYAFSFEILDQDDLAVYFNATSLTITTDYTVTINANGTGSVNIVTGGSVPSTPTASDQIVIVGARDIERVTDFVTAGDLLASSLNEQLDALTIFDQQVAEENKRGLRAPVYDPALIEDGGVVDMTLPAKAVRASKFLAFDADGNPTATTNVGEYKGNWAAATSYVVGDLVTDTTDNSIYRVNTAHTASGVLPLSTNTNNSYYDLFVDLSAVTAAQVAAAASAAAAAADVVLTNADVVTTNANVALTNADVVLTNADVVTTGNNVIAAQAAEAAALAALDSFDDRYLGVFASDPTLDNDGNPLVAGSLYFNSVAGAMKVYTGSVWVAAYVSGTGFLAITGGTMTGNIVLSTADITGTGNVNITGSVTATSFVGDGSSLTNLPAAGIADVVDDTTPQLGGNLDTNGNDINFGDNDKAQFGAGSDLQIYHDGSNSFIDDAGTGVLSIRSNSISLGKYTGENLASFVADGAATLYYDNAAKLATTATGVSVTGTLAATAVTGDGSALTNLPAASLTASSTIPSEGGAATTNIVQGLAKAWCNLNGTGTIAQRDSLNHSSTTDNTTGTYTFSLVSSMGNTNYISPTNCDRTINTRHGTEGVQYFNIATGSYKIECVNAVPNLSDEELVNTQTLGDLA